MDWYARDSELSKSSRWEHLGRSTVAQICTNSSLQWRGTHTRPAFALRKKASLPTRISMSSLRMPEQSLRLKLRCACTHSPKIPVHSLINTRPSSRSALHTTRYSMRSIPSPVHERLSLVSLSGLVAAAQMALTAFSPKRVPRKLRWTRLQSSASQGHGA
eukprot:6195145-Pleurochrysis_carterae.AAC.1